LEEKDKTEDKTEPVNPSAQCRLSRLMPFAEVLN
jgi:hypothetical protein